MKKKETSETRPLSREDIGRLPPRIQEKIAEQERIERDRNAALVFWWLKLVFFIAISVAGHHYWSQFAAWKKEKAFHDNLDKHVKAHADHKAKFLEKFEALRVGDIELKICLPKNEATESWPDVTKADVRQWLGLNEENTLYIDVSSHLILCNGEKAILIPAHFPERESEHRKREYSGFILVRPSRKSAIELKWWRGNYKVINLNREGQPSIIQDREHYLNEYNRSFSLYQIDENGSPVIIYQRKFENSINLHPCEPEFGICGHVAGNWIYSDIDGKQTLIENLKAYHGSGINSLEGEIENKYHFSSLKEKQ